MPFVSEDHFKIYPEHQQTLLSYCARTFKSGWWYSIDWTLLQRVPRSQTDKAYVCEQHNPIQLTGLLKSTNGQPTIKWNSWRNKNNNEPRKLRYVLMKFRSS